MSLQHRIRLRSMVWTDQRAKTLLEVLGSCLLCLLYDFDAEWGNLGSMRVVKYFCYELPFLQSEYPILYGHITQPSYLRVVRAAEERVVGYFPNPSRD